MNATFRAKVLSGGFVAQDSCEVNARETLFSVPDTLLASRVSTNVANSMERIAVHTDMQDREEEKHRTQLSTLCMLEMVLV